ncbi:MAG TPA: 3-dehydroquinate synthase family protein, partial [Planctomycetota bacterium]|nr:3-dehydroquinate synthase family protein [Planctomycetota bacterium]
AALDAAGLDRDGELLAVGGGVVTDLGGLAAALHRRGIAWRAAPTTLVGQVDAALGGKTAVNLAGGKNAVGCFHMPAEVLIDPGVLATLPERHLRNGLVEALKTALIAGEDLVAALAPLQPADFVEARPAAVEVIRRCVAFKLALVEQDPLDRGPRRLLNLGHTFGHAFEALALPRLLHGEAVGLGLLCAARLARERAGAQPGLEARLRALLSGWGLPVRWSAEPQAVLGAMRRDKKRQGGRPVLVLPLAEGRVEIAGDLPESAVAAALDAVLGPASTP